MEAVIASAILAIAQGRAADATIGSASRLAMAALCALVAAILVMATVGCATASLWIWTAPQLGPAGAPLAVAGALLVLCLAMLALMRRILRRRRPMLPAEATPAVLLAEAIHLYKDHNCSALVAAVFAGLAAGRDGR